MSAALRKRPFRVACAAGRVPSARSGHAPVRLGCLPCRCGGAL